MPVPPPTAPSSTAPPPARGERRGHVLGLDVEAVDVVEEAVPGLADDRQAPRADSLAVLRRGDERVAHDADGVRVRQPDRRRQQPGVADPFEPGQLTVAVDPVRAGEERLGRRQDDGDSRPDAVAFDQRRVADPDPLDVRDRVRRAGWETADLDSEVAGARHVSDDSLPSPVRCPAHGDDGVTHGSWRPRDRDRGRRPLEPEHLAALHARVRAARGPARRRRPARRRHGQAHRPLAEGQVRRPRAGLRGPDLVGRGQRGDLGGALRRAAREGRRAHRRQRRLRRRCVRRRRPEAADRRPRRHELPLPRALRPHDVHRPDRRRAPRLRAAGTRPARARARGRSRGGRDARRHVRRAASVAARGADRRHLLCGRDQEVDLHADERSPAARGRLPDALLGERRRPRATSPSSSGSPAPARRRSRPIPSAR